MFTYEAQSQILKSLLPQSFLRHPVFFCIFSTVIRAAGAAFSQVSYKRHLSAAQCASVWLVGEEQM